MKRNDLIELMFRIKARVVNFLFLVYLTSIFSENNL